MEETDNIKSIQDDIHKVMIEMKNKFGENKHSKLVLMNLTNVSKELNLMINESIIEKIEDEEAI